MVVAGKFFRQGDTKVFLSGVCYGPFQPNQAGECFPEPDQLRADFAQIQSLGFDTVRVYTPPSEAVLAEASRLGLRLLAGVDWTDHVDFISEPRHAEEARARLLQEARRLAAQPCVAGLLVGNEIEKTLVRWMGPRRVQRLLEEWIEEARRLAPGLLLSYATYPSTEYLVPRNADFLAVNLYLEAPGPLASYLARLQNLAGNKPLLVTEFGLDVKTHGEAAQAEAARWARQCLERAGAAGGVWFSHTDEWHRGGAQVRGWNFGLVDERRRERPVCAVMRQLHERRHPETSGTTTPTPRVSVIVCTHNGTATLEACLASLARLRHANHEVLLVDDGSKPAVAEIAARHPAVRYARQEHAGLSVARNLGASLATGEILAYTDDDCVVEEDWLTHLAAAFDDPRWVAVGGPNIPPPPRNRTEAVVAAAPGAPAHVLLSDQEAEHLPGCNLAVRKSALLAVGGFRAHYKTAGDDVDICWRLREAGGRLRYTPAAMVWHHRRYTVRAYLRQQRGYGYAEALLMKDHPDRFGPLGGARWSGGIYGDQAAAHTLMEGGIFHGRFGSGLFQGIYQQGGSCLLEWTSGVIWVALALASLAAGQPWLAGLLLAGSLLTAWYRLYHLPVPPFALSFREKALLLLLCWWQPLVREWQRLAGMLRLGARPTWRPRLREVLTARRPRKLSWQVACWRFWSDNGVGREEWLDALRQVLAETQAPHRLDDGWRWFDVETHPGRWVSTGFMAVTEYHGNGRQLTRIRITQRVSKGLVAVTGVLAVAALWVGFKDLRALTPVTTALGALGVLAVPVILIHLGVNAFLGGRYVAEQAARRCGLLDMATLPPPEP